MKIIKIPTHNETLVKVQQAMSSVEDPQQKASIELSYSELRWIERLLLSEEATQTLMFESLEKHIAFTKAWKESRENAKN